MAHFIQLVNVGVSPQGELLEKLVYLEPVSVMTMNRDTLTLGGNRQIAVTKLLLVKDCVSINIDVRETPDVVDSKVEAAIAEARTMTMVKMTLPNPGIKETPHG